MSEVTTTGLMFTVQGRPAPQGSKRHVGRGVMLEMSPHVKAWRDAVRTAAAAAWEGRAPLAGPVSVEVTFTVARPASHFGTGRNALVLKAAAPAWPTVPPDVDKCVRSTLDAITAAGVWKDDALVVEVTARKVYPGGWDSLEAPGAVVRVHPLTDTSGD